MKSTHHPSHAPRRTPRRANPAPDVVDADAPLELPAPQAHELIEGPSREDLIRRRAYDLYQRSGCVDGHAQADWLAAEAELGRELIEGASPMEDAGERQ